MSKRNETKGKTKRKNKLDGSAGALGSSASAPELGNTTDSAWQGRRDPDEEDEVETSLQRYKVVRTTYCPLAAGNRGERVHSGPPVLRASKSGRDCTKWVRDDPRNNPFCFFDRPDPSEPSKRKKPKVQELPRMWLPMTTEEYKIKMNTMSPTPCRGGVVGRTPWDGEHSTMESRSNEFIQTHTREYFDKPKRRENEGVPKVRELYSMNDRQCGWSDEPNQSVGFRRTFLDWVSDPKEQQKPSWWRQTVRTGASCNAPPLTEDDVEFSPTLSKPALEQSVLERLAQMPASQSSEFWRGWAEHGIPKKAIPEALLKGKSAKQVAELTKTISTAPAAATVLPPSPKGSSKPKVFKIGDKEMPEWDDRWYITHSKDNERLCKGHAQYFSSAQFLNGSEVGHPGSYLGLPSMKWRKLAKTVSHFPVGADGRLSVGRTSMLV